MFQVKLPKRRKARTFLFEQRVPAQVTPSIYRVNCNVSIPQESECMCEGGKKGEGMRKTEKSAHAKKTLRTGEQRGSTKTAGKRLSAQKQPL